MGPFGSNIKVETFVDSGIPVISGAHLRGTRVEDGDFNFVTPEHAERLKNSNVLRGDVVFTHAGNIGQVAYVPESSRYERYVISQRQFYLRCDRSKADPAFITYFFHSPEGQHKLLVNASQVGVPSISRPSSNLKEIEVALPPLAEQRAIAGFLGSIDDRIDNLRQTNATLEAIAQALFKSWFVDFDPVRAKSEGREPEGMDAATAALFPCELEDSELGPIPKGWRVGTLEDVSDLNASKWTARKHPEIVKYIDLSGVNRNRIETFTEFEFDAAPSRARNHLREGDTIVGTVRPGNRAYAHIHAPEENLTGSTGFAVLSPKKPYLSSFVYLAATSDEAIDRLTNLADGAAYPAVRPGVVASTPCVLPSDSVLEAFAEISVPMLEGIAKNNARAVAFAELSDTLLPRLISGKLCIAEPGAAAEDLSS
ncbi:restriction endonuclease subunit S [Pseudoxanthomonas suwonensis]|uniref:restriction endonuclease subunit S n=1 Tax=Pseudoxanthomonas suwonensis TaxID=314722 RepID=UPI0004B207F3|nr:restriction endonuclease subunit S [Pseudoxanthomonas suwonensis]